jgi:geranylgeranyl diphosphate synthase, type I
MSSPLQIYTAAHLPGIKKEIAQLFADKKTEAAELSPHLLSSLENLEEFVLRGGKFIRSVLVVLGYRLAGGKGDGIYKVAAAVELFHKYILSVDDMADRDEQRNGGPTLWRFYEQKFLDAQWADAAHHGRTFSEIDGLLLSSFTTELVRSADFPAEKLLSVLEIIDQIMYFRTIAGWQIHYVQNHQSLAEAKEAEYVHGLELVTAQYTFVAPLKIGAELALGKKAAAFMEPLTAYAEAIGKAFQIQDDILGVFGETAETGKPVGNDLREGKKTLLLQYAYRTANSDDKQFLEKICGAEINADELARAQKIMNETGSLEHSQNMANECVRMGLAALQKLPLKSEEASVLEDLAQFVVARKK